MDDEFNTDLFLHGLAGRGLDPQSFQAMLVEEVNRVEHILRYPPRGQTQKIRQAASPHAARLKAAINFIGYKQPNRNLPVFALHPIVKGWVESGALSQEWLNALFAEVM